MNVAETLAAAIAADARYATVRAQNGGDPAPYLDRVAEYADRLAAMVPAPDATAPTVTAPAPDGWGTPDLSHVPSDTYALAQDWYAVATGADLTGADGVFTQGTDQAKSQLAQLLGGIIGGGTRYYPLDRYPEIPAGVIATAGQAAVTSAAVAQRTALLSAGVYVPRPEAALIGLS